MKLWQWLTGSFAAGIGMMITVATFVKGTIYFRSEGTKLEERIDKLETKEREDLKDMHNKVIAIYQMMLENREAPPESGE